MEKSAWVGGLAAVGVLALVAAVVVMFGLGSDTGGSVRDVTREQHDVAIGDRTADMTPVREGRPPKGDDPGTVITGDGVERVRNPEGKGREFWAEKRQAQNEARKTRARGVLTTFKTSLEAGKATDTERVIEEMFSKADDIRTRQHAHEISHRDARDEMAELRSYTIVELTRILGGEDFSRLRTALRTADASWF